MMASSGGNSGRSPKDLRSIVNSHQNNELKFPEEMKANLEKLKALSKDDITENAMLRSRIDQQAELICILKQRADESLKKSFKLDKENGELRTTREDALATLQTETRKFYVLQKRFEVLNSNHEEIIYIKDDYKSQNVKLRRENERLDHENKLLFTETVKKRDDEIRSLRDEIQRIQAEVVLSDDSKRLIEQNMATVTEQSRKEKKLLEEKIAILEEKTAFDCKTLKEEIASLKNAQTSEGGRVKELQKERDEFAQLALERGKLLKEKQQENTRILNRLEEAEKTAREMGDKFTSELESMSTSAQVRRMKKLLEEAEKNCQDQQKEYDAYKKHMATLLNREKKINDKLRVLIG